MVDWNKWRGRKLTVTAYDADGEIELTRCSRRTNYIRAWLGIECDLRYIARVVLTANPEGVIAEFVRQVEPEQST